MTTHTHCDKCGEVIDDMDIRRAMLEVSVHNGVDTDIDDLDICVNCAREVAQAIREVLEDD